MVLLAAPACVAWSKRADQLAARMHCIVQKCLCSSAGLSAGRDHLSKRGAGDWRAYSTRHGACWQGGRHHCLSKTPVSSHSAAILHALAITGTSWLSG